MLRGGFLNMPSDIEMHRPAASDEWQQPESLSRAVKQVAVVAILLAGAVGFYFTRVTGERHARDASKLGKDELLKDNPKNYTAAEGHFKDALAARSNYPYALAFLAELNALRAVDHGIPGSAEEARKWIELCERKNVPYQEAFAAKALDLISQGKYAEAEKAMVSVLQRATGAQLWNALARAQRDQGKLETARANYKKANDMEWRNPRLAADYADSFYDAGDTLNAFNYYGKALEANSDHIRSLIGRSRSEIARGSQIKEATDTLTDILGRSDAELSPHLKAMALTARGELRQFEKNDASAAKDADQAISVWSGCAWAHQLKGLILARAKKSAAYDEFKQAMESDRSIPVIYFSGATALGEAGMGDKAIALLDAYVKTLPADDGYFMVYGDVLRKMNRLEDAAKQYDKAIEANPLNASAHFAKGRLLLQKKDFDNAKKELDKAVASNEFFGEAYEALGELHMAKKEFREAAESYFQALRIYSQLQMPRERLTGYLDDVAGRFKKSGQRDIAEAWVKEGKALIH
jgi:tetratricopeptide (TPR) repeat protein